MGRLRKAESSLKVWKQQQHKTLSFMVRFAAIKKYTQNPTLISINLRLSQIKQHLQWRV
jgi:hypothetical protein